MTMHALDIATTLPESEWRMRKQDHERRIDALIESRHERRLRGEPHPIDDFLFDYYPYSVGRLRTWHPGFGYRLAGDAREFLTRTGYEQFPDGIGVGCPPATVLARLRIAQRVLEGTDSRPAQYGCFGLHEWAMVDGLTQEQIRHEHVPLRLAPERITEVVDEIGLRCTHVDAYRFFTESAVPKNSLTPTRATQPHVEQAGCIHANMDLYKYAMWGSPYVPSDLVADAFALARRARGIDMAASPYDCRAFGIEPIAVETPEGRREYAREQRLIAAEAAPLRQRLRDVLAGISLAVPASR